MRVGAPFSERSKSQSGTPGDELFREIWEFAGDAMALSDPHGTVLAANSAYLQLYGYSAQEVIGHNFAIIFPEGQRKWANELYQQTFADPNIAPAVESTVRRKDGTERVVESRYTFVMEGDKRTAMISILRDFTGIRRAEADLRASQETFRSAFESAPIAIALAGLDGRYLQANPAFSTFTGYSQEELHELPFQALAAPEDLPGEEEKLNALKKGEADSYRIERRYIRKDGQVVWGLLSVSLVRDSEGNPLHFIRQTEDITERKRAEASEREARLQAEQAVLDRDRLLSIVAHDLRNPLTAIKATAQLLTRRLRRGTAADLESLERQVQQIERSAARMNAIVEEILDFSELQAGTPLVLGNRPIDLVELVQRVVEEGRRSNRGREIAFASTVSRLVGEWDPNRMERVFINLLENAIKYSPAGSAVRIAIEYEPGDKRQVSEPGVVRVRIADQGIGIPAADLPHIFDWYRRAGNARDWAGGTGIGLAGARQIVEQYGGTINVQSVEGEGSTFTVSLPVVDGNSAGHGG